MTKTINFRLLSIIFISLFLSFLLLWFMVSNPPPQIPINVTKTADLQEALHYELTKQISDLELDIEISTSLPVERLQKLQAELTKILAKTATGKICVQYALVATVDGYYPNYNRGGMIFLKAGEIYKYGKTCIGADRRYRDLKQKKLIFVPQFRGTAEECLIVEKIKIYNYLVHPENINRARKTKTALLLRPPGNKIDR